MKQFTVRLDGDVEVGFEEIKKSIGLKNDTEVVRYLVKNHHSVSAPTPKSEAIA
jgi:hypothetical protein